MTEVLPTVEWYWLSADAWVKFTPQGEGCSQYVQYDADIVWPLKQFKAYLSDETVTTGITCLYRTVCVTPVLKEVSSVCMWASQDPEHTTFTSTEYLTHTRSGGFTSCWFVKIPLTVMTSSVLFNKASLRLVLFPGELINDDVGVSFPTSDPTVIGDVPDPVSWMYVADSGIYDIDITQLMKTNRVAWESGTLRIAVWLRPVIPAGTVHAYTGGGKEPFVFIEHTR